MRTFPGAARLAAGVLALPLLAACVAAPPRVRMPERPAEEERLVAVPAGTPAAPAASTAPSLSVVAVSAQPARVRPGDETAMIVTYSLGGVTAATPVEEHRQLLKDSVLVQEWRDTVSRAPGSHTSSKPLRVAAQALPGIYTLRVALTAGGARAEGSGIFEVR